MCQPPGMDSDYIREYIMPELTPCDTSTYLDPLALPPEKFWCVRVPLKLDELAPLCTTALSL